MSDTKYPFKSHARHTIMDGKVVTYATGFEGNKTLPTLQDPTGPFEISASRNAVIVHSAQLQTDDHFAAFEQAFDAAKRMHGHLASCDGRPRWGETEEAE